MNADDRLSFATTAECDRSGARCGRLRTPHGTVETPVFVPCATRGALKGITAEQAAATGAQMLLANTYHLFLQPGPEAVAARGGLHRFMNWPRPLLTDSGGFQIFSFGHGSVADEIKGRRKQRQSPAAVELTEEGAAFRSYVDGRRVFLSPEGAVEAQQRIGADLIVVLDECTPYHVDREYTARSMERSHRWGLRGLERFRETDDGRQGLYGIVQGGVYEDLRAESSAFVAGQPFFGQAIGGSLGSDPAQMEEVVAWSRAGLPRERPTHLLGIGGIRDLWRNAAHGIDSFDCVHPTRLARHGGALCVPGENGGQEHLNLRNARFRDDPRPLDERVPHPASREYSRAYLHYLVRAGESLGGQLLALHNLAFLAWMMERLRESIREGRFPEEAGNWTGA